MRKNPYFYFSFFLLVFNFVFKEVFAAFDNLRDFSVDTISTRTVELFTNPSFSNVWQYVILVIAPFLLIWLILYSIILEIGFFSSTLGRKIPLAISLLLAIISIPTGILTGLVYTITSFGSFMAIVIFSTALFVLGLSHYYRKKAREYGFFIGSKVFTIFIVHSPLILMFTFAGYYVGSKLLIGLPVYFFLILIGVLIVIILFKKSYFKDLKTFFKNHTVGSLIALSIFIIVVILSFIFSKELYGAMFGFLLGFIFALLEAGRRYNFDTVLEQLGEDTKKPMKEKAELTAVRKALYSMVFYKENAPNGLPEQFVAVKQGDKKLLKSYLGTDCLDEENRKLKIEEVEKLIAEIDYKIKSFETKAEAEILDELYGEKNQDKTG